MTIYEQLARAIDAECYGKDYWPLRGALADWIEEHLPDRGWEGAILRSNLDVSWTDEYRMRPRFACAWNHVERILYLRWGGVSVAYAQVGPAWDWWQMCEVSWTDEYRMRRVSLKALGLSVRDEEVAPLAEWVMEHAADYTRDWVYNRQNAQFWEAPYWNE